MLHLDLKTILKSLSLSALAFFLVVGVLLASSTIGTNISTAGTLTVTDTSTLTGAVTMSSTLSVTGLATLLGGATTTNLTLLNGEVISNAVDGVVQINGVASSTSVTLLNGETITNATDGTITLGATNAVLVGTASTSALMVGDEPSASTINGLAFGYCNLSSASVAASSTVYANCTGATGVVASDRVFVQATSSLPANFILRAASSTATAGTINVQLFNTGLTEGVFAATAATGQISVNFWAVR